MEVNSLRDLDNHIAEIISTRYHSLDTLNKLIQKDEIEKLLSTLSFENNQEECEKL